MNRVPGRRAPARTNGLLNVALSCFSNTRIPKYLVQEEQSEALEPTQRQRKSKIRLVQTRQTGPKLNFPAFINYLDGGNLTFLSKEYLDQTPLIKKSAKTQPISCDLSSIQSLIDAEAARLEDEGKLGEKFDLAFVGRSNVGKSSLINALLGVEITQTSKTPGKTKELTFIPLEKAGCRLVDCPGYGFAKTSQTEKEKWKKFMQVYLKRSTSLQRIMLLIDLSVGLHDNDQLLMETLTESSQPFSLVFTKVDRIKKENQVREKAEKIVTGIVDKGMTMCNPIVHLVSSHTGFGLRELKSDAVFILSQPKLNPVVFK